MAERTFVERIWFSDDPGARMVRRALYPFERAYGAIMGARDMLYEAGWLHSETPALTTISVGNLSVGGTGKTPIAAWIADGLAARGARPVVVLRGYGDDEPQVHRVLNPRIPVIVDSDRVAAIKRAAAEGANVAVLDDAFQHRRARRNADVVLVSADMWTTNDRLIPAGPWREPLSALDRATLIVVTRKAASDATVEAVHESLVRAVPNVPRVSVRLEPSALVSVGTLAEQSEGPAETMPVSALAGADVHVLVGIADPHAFVSQLEALGARVVPTIYPDHHPFDAGEVERFVATLGPNSWAVCTLKDAVKLAHRWPRQAPPLWYVSQRVTVERGVGGLERVLDDLVRSRSRLTPTAG